jgi:hypothetical protein
MYLYDVTFLVLLHFALAIAPLLELFFFGYIDFYLIWLKFKGLQGLKSEFKQFLKKKSDWQKRDQNGNAQKIVLNPRF